MAAGRNCRNVLNCLTALRYTATQLSFARITFTKSSSASKEAITAAIYPACRAVGTVALSTAPPPPLPSV